MSKLKSMYMQEAQSEAGSLWSFNLIVGGAQNRLGRQRALLLFCAPARIVDKEM